MNISKKIKNITLGTLVTLSTIGAIVKTSDYFSKQINKNFKTHYTTADILALQDTIDHSLVHDNLLHNLSETRQNDINTAMQAYTTHALPEPNYSTDKILFNRLVENRIRNKVFPGATFPTGLEEFNINIRKTHGDALCASAIWAKLRMLNIRSEDMRQFFEKQGKHSRFAQQLLSQHGRESTVGTIDQTEYYDQTTTDYLHPHYKHILKNLHNSTAGNIITARYTSSGSLQLARHEGKNATHSILSLGTITQELTGSQLGMKKGSQIYDDFIIRNETEQKVIIAYQLLKTRAIKENMIGEESAQKDRIRQLLGTYPNLLSITTNIENTQGEEFEITFKGLMGEHVYPIDKKPTNYIHYFFELIAYNGGKLNRDGSVFLPSDEMTPTQTAIKDNSYSILSPLYNKINTVREKITHPDMILKTYIVPFDDIDHNRDKKINNKIINRKKDKTISEVLEEMAEVCYNDSHTKTKLTQQETKEYLKKYLHMLGAMDRFPTGTILPIPYLTKENRVIIDKLYGTYIIDNNNLEHNSQKKYADYIMEKLKTISLTNLNKNPIVIYPVCTGDDEMSITQQVCKYIDQMVEYQPDMGNKKIKLNNLSREEYNRIFKIIQGNIIFPASYPKQALRADQKVYINLAQVIKSINKKYYPTKSQLSQNYIPPVLSSELKNFDEIYDILDINESTENIQKHDLIRETGGEISIFDIAKTRSRTKMMMEYLDFDDNSLLRTIKPINSEGPLQIRLDYYLTAKNDIALIIQSSQKILEKAKELGINNSQREQLQQIIVTSTELQETITIMEKKKMTTSQEFQQKRGKLKHILSDIINLTGNSLDNPKSDLGTLLSIQISAYSIERYLWRYTDKLQESIGEKTLTKEEISFVQHFTVIAHHLGQQDADQAFKIYMSIHLMWTAKEMGIISQEDNMQFQNICKQLNQIRRVDNGFLDKYNPAWYKDRYTIVKDTLGQDGNEYNNQIIKYLQPRNNIAIPHYNTIRDKKIDNISQYISTNIFEANATKEFSLYLTTIPPKSDGLSAIFLLLTAIAGGAGLYKINKKKDIT